MCGINGIQSGKHSTNDLSSAVRIMNQTLAHRGPDHDGIFQHEQICLGHRRLSIIDLSPESNQPFFSDDKQHVIVFNGEIYNYRELKLELQRASHGSQFKPHFFKTGSDTEVLLAAYLRWGDDCLKHINGMFAFAIYNLADKKLFIARDRLGVKPLYYHYSDDLFIFSSEVRPFLRSGIISFELNRDALAEYIQYQTVHAPNTIVKGIRMLMPGHYLVYANNKATLTEYWKPENFIQKPDLDDYNGIKNKTYELLAASVNRRLVSDVPFGAFLSGGIDSSIVVGFMSRILGEKVKTFNVSFDESEFSESRYAKIIAKKFNTDHHEIKLLPKDFLNELPEALDHMDHPSGDGPNTYIVSKATKQAGITMALSGIGGDELFAGYENFKRLYALTNNNWLKVTPRIARQMSGWILKTLKPSIASNRIAELLKLPNFQLSNTYPYSRTIFSSDELKKISDNTASIEKFQNELISAKNFPDHTLSCITSLELRTYLSNVLLRDTDQMSMAVALEVREPFLDYQLVEFILGIPDKFKYPITPKKLLIDSVGDLLPSEIINRPKMGFTLPWQHWMKNELQEFCQKNILALDQKRLLNKNAAHILWQRFLHNDKLVTWSRIWHLVVLNYWIDKNLGQN